MARLSESFGPYATRSNRFVRWRKADVWAHIMDALATAHDVAVQMIDTSFVRLHQHGGLYRGECPLMRCELREMKSARELKYGSVSTSHVELALRIERGMVS